MPRIDKLYAYVVTDSGPGDEGVPCIGSPAGPLPLMGADEERMRCLYNAAVDIARREGKVVRLLQSTGMEVIEVIGPNAEYRPSCHPEKHP